MLSSDGLNLVLLMLLLRWWHHFLVSSRAELFKRPVGKKYCTLTDNYIQKVCLFPFALVASSLHALLGNVYAYTTSAGVRIFLLFLLLHVSSNFFATPHFRLSVAFSRIGGRAFSLSVTWAMAAACGGRLGKRRASFPIVSLRARGHMLKKVIRPFLFLQVLFLCVSFQHVQHSTCERGPLSEVWWRLRNKSFLERMWSRTLTYFVPEAFDSEWVYQQMNFCPLGVCAFLNWTSTLARNEHLYAWHILLSNSGVKSFMDKFKGVHILVGKEDPVQKLTEVKEMIAAMERGAVGKGETNLLYAVERFRKGFFNTASSICDALTAQDGEELKQILLKTIPPMRQCVAGLLQLTTDPSSTKMEAARVVLGRWIHKLFRLDFAFLSLCPDVPAALLEDYLALGKGMIPSAAVAVTIINDVPEKWRSDELLKALVPVATHSLARKL